MQEWKNWSSLWSSDLIWNSTWCCILYVAIKQTQSQTKWIKGRSLFVAQWTSYVQCKIRSCGVMRRQIIWGLEDAPEISFWYVLLMQSSCYGAILIIYWDVVAAAFELLTLRLVCRGPSQLSKIKSRIKIGRFLIPIIWWSAGIYCRMPYMRGCK